MVGLIQGFKHLNSLPLRGDRWLWHGSTYLGDRRIDGFCDIWRSSSSSQNGIASPLSQNKPLTFAPREVPCYRKLVVICVEVMALRCLRIGLSLYCSIKLNNTPFHRIWVNTMCSEELANAFQTTILTTISSAAALHERMCGFDEHWNVQTDRSIWLSFFV